MTRDPDTSDEPEAPVDDADLAVRRAELVELLRATGASTDSGWLVAFAVVPRHLFVPEFLHTTVRDGQVYTETITSPSVPWRDAVYTDAALMTRADVTSSSTAPSVMARMLDALDVTRGQQLLEIGTGTGYNTALLCARLGEEHVHSVEIDPSLLDDARRRLEALGYRPDLVCADGRAGHPGGGPYDRILATCRVETIPPAWLAQLNPHGTVVVPVSTGIARLRRDGDHPSASGRFLPDHAYFMALRSVAAQNDLRVIARRAADAPGTSPSPEVVSAAGSPDTPGATLWDDVAARFWVELLVPGVVRGSVDDVVLLYHRDGSWARIHPDGVVHQGGPRQLWTRIVNAYRSWERRGRPHHDEVGLTVTPDGQRVWLGHPDHIVEEQPHDPSISG